MKDNLTEADFHFIILSSLLVQDREKAGDYSLSIRAVRSRRVLLRQQILKIQPNRFGCCNRLPLGSPLRDWALLRAPAW